MEIAYGELEAYLTLVPDEDGGVFVQVPVFDPLTAPGSETLKAKSLLTGKTLTEALFPAPSVAALWATIKGPGALEITGIGTKATGLIHSEGNLTLRGSGLELTGGIEYSATLDSHLVGSNNITPSPLRVDAGGSPILRDIADFRPGGKFATLAGANYHAIDAFGCVGGVWRPALGQIPTGIIYVPCAVELSGVGTLVDATIVAEGKISIVGSGITVQPFIDFMPGLVTAATGADAILIAGNQVRVDGTIFAPQGTALIAGVGGIYRCGVVAARISIVKAINSFLVDEDCRIP